MKIKAKAKLYLFVPVFIAPSLLISLDKAVSNSDCCARIYGFCIQHVFVVAGVDYQDYLILSAWLLHSRHEHNFFARFLDICCIPCISWATFRIILPEQGNKPIFNKCHLHNWTQSVESTFFWDVGQVVLIEM